MLKKLLILLCLGAFCVAAMGAGCGGDKDKDKEPEPKTPDEETD